MGPQNHRLSLKQSFPWFGTLGAQKDVAGHAAEAAFRRLEAEELKLFYEVTGAFNAYYYAGRELAIDHSLPVQFHDPRIRETAA